MRSRCSSYVPCTTRVKYRLLLKVSLLLGRILVRSKAPGANQFISIRRTKLSTTPAPRTNRHGSHRMDTSGCLLTCGANSRAKLRHADYGMLTLLLTDGVPGLEILVDRAWAKVPHVAGALVVNLGDMLERRASPSAA